MNLRHFKVKKCLPNDSIILLTGLWKTTTAVLQFEQKKKKWKKSKNIYISYLQQCIRKFVKNSSQLDQLIVQKWLWCPKHFVLHFVDRNYLPLFFASIIYNLHFHIMYYYRTVHKNPFRYLDAQWAGIFKKVQFRLNKIKSSRIVWKAKINFFKKMFRVPLNKTFQKSFIFS